MGLFKKKNNDNSIVNGIELSQEEKEMIERLKQGAGCIIELLKAQLKSEERLVLIFASGLAGIACHEAVKATNGTFSVVETNSGKKFYFGDDVNKYLLENRFSVVSFCTPLYPVTENNITEMVARFAENVGNSDYKIWDEFAIEEVYKYVKPCWDGIFENITQKYCKTPEEWPILMGIVAQNVVMWISRVAPVNQLINMVIDCSNVLSKMDDDSI